MSSVHDDYCPVYASIDLLQEKWVLHIVRSLLEAPHGFNELGRAVGGVNTTTLSARLEHLEQLGVVDKTVESTMPPRTRYELTQAGRALQSVVDAIDAWARAYMPRCQAAAADRAAAPADVADPSAARDPVHQ